MKIKLDAQQSKALAEWISDSDVTLHIGEGHSGPGIYVSVNDQPEEGAEFIAPLPADAQPFGIGLKDGWSPALYHSGYWWVKKSHAERLRTPSAGVQTFAVTPSDDARDAARWRACVAQGEFPIKRGGMWMHVMRPEGNIIDRNTVEEIADEIVASDSQAKVRS